MKNKNKCIVLFITFLLLTGLIAAYFYLNDPIYLKKRLVFEFCKSLDWSTYESDCMVLLIDFDSDLIELRDDWWSIKAHWQKICTGPWDDKETYAYFNTATGDTYVETSVDQADYWMELININLQIRNLLEEIKQNTCNCSQN